MFKDLKVIYDKYVVPQFNLKELGKEALEALAFVLLDRLEAVVEAAGLDVLKGPLKDLREKADMIDGEKDRT